VAAYFIHQVRDTGKLFAECSRCLRDEGKIVLLTSSHWQIEEHHPVIGKFFPRAVEIDKKRFQDIHEIDSLLKLAGFNGIKHLRVLVERIPIDAAYLEKVRNKYVSTYNLLDEEEFERGLEKLEVFIRQRTLPRILEWWGTLICGNKTK
jgi:SAM-dependent methyltransferase